MDLIRAWGRKRPETSSGQGIRVYIDLGRSDLHPGTHHAPSRRSLVDGATDPWPSSWHITSSPHDRVVVLHDGETWDAPPVCRISPRRVNMEESGLQSWSVSFRLRVCAHIPVAGAISQYLPRCSIPRCETDLLQASRFAYVCPIIGSRCYRCAVPAEVR